MFGKYFFTFKTHKQITITHQKNKQKQTNKINTRGKNFCQHQMELINTINVTRTGWPCFQKIRAGESQHGTEITDINSHYLHQVNSPHYPSPVQYQNATQTSTNETKTAPRFQYKAETTASYSSTHTQKTTALTQT